MMGQLLLRGMIVGLVAGLLCFGFLKLAGEPQVDRAIAFETAMDEAKAQADKAAGMVMPPDEPELVSRATQAGIGLLTGVVVYSAAFGGLFAIAFALVNGRVGGLSARANAALLAGAGFVAVYLVPVLKFPANPPSVGQPDTIGSRTALYFAMMALSLAAMIAGVLVCRRLLRRWGAWNAVLAGAAVYIGAMIVCALALPAVNEVPEAFPAVVLWQFRIASLGAQVILWATLGLVFGALVERRAVTSGARPLRASTT